MTGDQERKILIFGAGRIGRSFIGQLFSRTGYEVVFTDIDRKIIRLLNETGSYRVVIRDASPEILTISNVRGIYSGDREAVTREIISTRLIALSVGQQGLDAAIGVLAEGLRQKHLIRPGRLTDIIIAENMVNGDRYVRDKLAELLGPAFPDEGYPGLVETSIGKMVPFMSEDDLREDPLQVFAESYNTLIVAGRAFKNPVPEVAGLSPKDNIKAWVDRKLFIHNLGHAAAAYYGFLKYPRRQFLFEVLADKEVYEQAYRVMKQSAAILRRKHPGEFSIRELDDHIRDLLQRFVNPELRDTVFRVGCDLRRKLSPDNRMVYPLRAGIKYGLPADHILYALVCGFYFRARDANNEFHPGDAALFEEYPADIKELMTEISGFDPENDKILLTKAGKYCTHINAKFVPEVKLA